MKKTSIVTLTGLLSAAAIVLSALESAIPTEGLLPPGVKLGLSNIATMFGAFSLGLPSAAAIAAVKGVFALLTRGGMACLLSLCGGCLSALAVSLLARADRKGRLGFTGISILGALSHNAGQLVAVMLITSPAAAAYGPVLAVSAVVSGTVTGVLLKAVWPYMKRIETGIRTAARRKTGPAHIDKGEKHDRKAGESRTRPGRSET